MAEATTRTARRGIRVTAQEKRLARFRNAKRLLKNNYELYLFILPAVIFFAIFHYYPMYGLQIAFKDFDVSKGIWGSEWVGLEHFLRFFNSYYFWTLIKNTIGISVYTLAVNFPLPILLALMLNEVGNAKFKKFVQTVTYAPHFISMVVMVGMILSFLSPNTGIVNLILQALGGDSIYFMGEASMFKTIYVVTGAWQGTGWGAIIYLANLSSVDPQLHEAATIDGATRLQRIRYINFPVLLPTIIIMLIMRTGNIMSVGFEKVFLMQNSLNMETSDVISTYVYRAGLQQAQFSFSAAVGFFNSVINFILLTVVNQISKKVGETSLW